MYPVHPDIMQVAVISQEEVNICCCSASKLDNIGRAKVFWLRGPQLCKLPSSI